MMDSAFGTASIPTIKSPIRLLDAMPCAGRGAFRAQNSHRIILFIAGLHHPDFTVDDIHVLKLKENRDELNREETCTYREYMFNQVRKF